MAAGLALMMLQRKCPGLHVCGCRGKPRGASPQRETENVSSAAPHRRMMPRRRCRLRCRQTQEARGEQGVDINSGKGLRADAEANEEAATSPRSQPVSPANRPKYNKAGDHPDQTERTAAPRPQALGVLPRIPGSVQSSWRVRPTLLPVHLLPSRSPGLGTQQALPTVCLVGRGQAAVGRFQGAPRGAMLSLAPPAALSEQQSP